MGIGAFESREFIRGLGGNISVHSTPGRGSIFRVRIPCTGETKVGFGNKTLKANIL
jgi:signal transduction histidine kinase